jgi:hypothetical protein
MKSMNRIACACLIAVLAGRAQAQSSLLSNPLGREQNGWRLYNVTASFGYSTLALPSVGTLPAFSLERLESDYDGTASASFGYNYGTSKTHVSMLYSPSYVRRVRFSELKTFNQSMSLSVSRELAPRWDFSVSLVGADTTLDQLLFTPAILSATTSPVATVDDLIQAARVGQYTSDQLASILTGTPYVSTPSRSIVYGSSYVSASLTGGLTYRFSPRLSFTFSGGASRSQTRNDSQKDLQGQLNYLIPRNTNEQASAAVNYSLTPRTQLGGQTNTSWVDSSFRRYSITSVTASLNRKLTPHWFAGIQGGTGFVNSMGTQTLSGQLPTGPGYIAQGNIGYTAHEHSLAASYGRGVSDNYGFGSQASETIAGSWQWRRPGRPWSVYASIGSQRMIGGVLTDVRYWYGNAGFARALSRQFSVNLTYAYVDRPTDPSVINASTAGLSGYSTRVTLVWNPSGRESQSAGPGPAGGMGGAGGTGPVR